MAADFYIDPLWTAGGKKALDYMTEDIIVLGAGRNIIATAAVLTESGLYRNKLIIPATEGTKRYLEKLFEEGHKLDIGTVSDLAGKKYTYFDGADRIVTPEFFEKEYRGLDMSRRKMLIKGGDKGTGDPGKEGCMKKEWDLAYGAGRFIVIVDYTKMTPILSLNFRVPVEFNPLMDYWTRKYIEHMMKTKDLVRREYNGHTFVTENNNHIYDVNFDDRKFGDLAKFNRSLRAHGGIVSTGMFVEEDVIPDFAIIAPEKGDPFVYE